MVQYSRPFFPGGIYGARLNWVQFPPHPTPPPPGGREKQGSLPPGGGGRNKAPSPLVGEGETRLPPPLWGRVGVGGKGKHVQSPRAQYTKSKVSSSKAMPCSLSSSNPYHSELSSCLPDGESL